jgi:hypothetical protein
MTTDTMRAEFEAWANEREMHIGWDAEEEEYQSYPTHTAWLAWQASAEAERGRCASIVDQHESEFAVEAWEPRAICSDIAKRIRAFNRVAAQET